MHYIRSLRWKQVPFWDSFSTAFLIPHQFITKWHFTVFEFLFFWHAWICSKIKHFIINMFFPTWISVFKSDNGFFETQRGLCANAGYSHVLSPFQTAEFIQLICLERIKTSQHSYTKTIQISRLLHYWYCFKIIRRTVLSTIKRSASNDLFKSMA